MRETRTRLGAGEEKEKGRERAALETSEQPLGEISATSFKLIFGKLFNKAPY